MTKTWKDLDVENMTLGQKMALVKDLKQVHQAFYDYDGFFAEIAVGSNFFINCLGWKCGYVEMRYSLKNKPEDCEAFRFGGIDVYRKYNSERRNTELYYDNFDHGLHFTMNEIVEVEILIKILDLYIKIADDKLNIEKAEKKIKNISKMF